MKKTVLVLVALVWVVAAATGQQAQEDAGTGPVRETLSRYLGPPAPFGLLATAGYSADFWRVSFEEDGPSNSTTASVTRDPFLLVVGGIDFYNILGYIDWNVTYRTDNVDGALDLLEADVETGPGRGNVDFESTLQVPLGYIGAGLGLLGAPPESVRWLNFLRFQWVPIERYFRWEFELEGAGVYIDQDGDAVSADGAVLFPARYRERRYGLLLGAWPLEPGSGINDEADALIGASTLELSYMSMRFTSPMQFGVSEAGVLGGEIATRQFITTNEAGGFYTRLTMGDPDILLGWFPDAWGITLWTDFFRGRTTLTTGAFELSSATADPAADFDNDKLVASRFGFGGGFYRQHVFGREGNGRLRWGASAFWQRYSYGPASFGFISSAFNEWETELTDDFEGRAAGEDVVVDFFREESFWGVKLEASLGF